MHENYSVRIEVLDNGYKVEVPDMEKRAEKKKAAAKNKDSSPYLGDCTKSYVAKTPKEVLKLVEGSLKDIPGTEYDVAWNED